jgi:uncharacterized protein
MATDLIRYDLLVQQALRGVVRNVLAEAARNGLQGDHHFFITFKTNAPGLRLSNRMRERYPDEMTIILQHQFWDLAVTDHAFEVGLSFNKAPERLLVPFDSITSFVDPSVQFGLKFDVAIPEPDAVEAEPEQPVPRVTNSTKPTLAAVEKMPRKLPVKVPEPVVALKPHDVKPATPPIKPPVPAKPVLAKVPDRPAADEKKSDGDSATVVSIDAFRKKP